MHPNLKKKVMNMSIDKKGAVEGIFDINEVCDTLVAHCEMKGYTMDEKDRGQNSDPPNRELLTYYDGYRYISDYYKLWIQYKIQMSGRDVEVVVDGKKKIMTQGKAELVVSTYLQEDPYGKRDASKLAKFFINLYEWVHGETTFSQNILIAAGDAGELVKVFKQACGAKVY